MIRWSFIFALGCGLAQAEVRYTYSDHLGSASVVTDASGAVIQIETYTPFGEILTPHLSSSPQRGEERGEGAIPYLYTSQELDHATELYNYGARYYDPALSQFTSIDPVFDSPSPYAYVNNNPIRLIDPDGRSSKDTREIAKVFRFGVTLLDMYPAQIEKVGGEIHRLEDQRAREIDPEKIGEIDKKISSKRRRVERWRKDWVTAERETGQAAEMLRGRGIDPQKVLYDPVPFENFSTEDSEVERSVSRFAEDSEVERSVSRFAEDSEVERSVSRFTVFTGLVSAFLFMLTIENDCGPVGCNGECGITGCGSDPQGLRSDIGLGFPLELEKIRESCNGEECFARLRKLAQEQGLEKHFSFLEVK